MYNVSCRVRTNFKIKELKCNPPKTIKTSNVLLIYFSETTCSYRDKYLFTTFKHFLYVIRCGYISTELVLSENLVFLLLYDLMTNLCMKYESIEQTCCNYFRTDIISYLRMIKVNKVRQNSLVMISLQRNWMEKELLFNNRDNNFISACYGWNDYYIV